MKRKKKLNFIEIRKPEIALLEKESVEVAEIPDEDGVVPRGDEEGFSQTASAISDAIYKPQASESEIVISIESFLELLHGLSRAESAALSDDLFDSVIVEQVIDRKGEEYETRQTSMSEITAQANSLSVEEFWGSGIELAGLSDLEERQVRQFLLDSFAKNSELQELKRNQEITFEEYVALRMTSEKIGKALVPIIGEAKAQSLLASHLETMNSRSVPYEVEAMQRDSNNFPAFDAVMKKDHVVLESLLAAGADVSAISEYRPDTSLLETGILFRDAKTVETLLRYDVDIDRKNSRGNSVLHQAISSENPEILGLLLAAGADPRARNQDGLTPAMSLRLRKSRLSEEVFRQMTEVLEAAQ